MRARSFFYVCAGVLMLAIAYQLGASRVEAQLPSAEFVSFSVGNTGNTALAMTANGDIYARNGSPVTISGCDFGWAGCGGWQFMGNVLDGPISVEKSTITDVKGKYRDDE